jgi:hypothetical protein
VFRACSTRLHRGEDTDRVTQARSAHFLTEYFHRLEQTWRRPAAGHRHSHGHEQLLRLEAVLLAKRAQLFIEQLGFPADDRVELIAEQLEDLLRLGRRLALRNEFVRLVLDFAREKETGVAREILEACRCALSRAG